MTQPTLITALYNINRENNGDGRKWSEYLVWFASTLQIKLPMAIFIPEDLVDFVNNNRPKELMHITYITTMEFDSIPFYKYYNDIKYILDTDIYKQKIKHPNRVECKLPEYNIIQYSKFGWLKEIAEINPFNSSQFFWIDAGISRFVDTTKNRKLNITIDDRFIIQHNHLLYNYKIDTDYLWDSQCLLCGTMFGGTSNIIKKMEHIVTETFGELINNGWANNEQILLAYLYNENKELYNVVLNNTNNHLMLFDYLFN